MALNEVRIIGGKWRGRKLDFDATEVRPTLGRVRVTLFNWLLPYLPGASVLDLFAGSGALGIEAQSRGASRTTLVERSTGICAQLMKTVARLDDPHLKVTKGDALGYLDDAAERGERFDVVFLDPPFDTDQLDRCLPRVPAVLARDGIVHFERSAAQKQTLEVPAPLSPWKSKTLGSTHFGLLAADPGDG